MFADELPGLARRFDPVVEKKEFKSTFLKNIPTGPAIPVLSKFQNNLEVSENNLIQFCINQVSSFLENYGTYSAITAQGRSYVGSGDQIEITAGAGAFSKASKPSLIFSGNIVPVKESGVTIYKFKAPEEAGKYFASVKIIYRNQEGREQIITKDVEYTGLRKFINKNNPWLRSL